MARLVAQRSRQAVETGGVGRQAKSQEVIGPVETSAPDMPSRQRGVQLRRMGMPGEPEQWRASGNRKARFHQDLVKLAGLLFKLAARVIGPWLVAERPLPINSAGPEQGHGPNAAEIRPIVSGAAMAKPSRNPARP